MEILKKSGHNSFSLQPISPKPKPIAVLRLFLYGYSYICLVSCFSFNDFIIFNSRCTRRGCFICATIPCVLGLSLLIVILAVSASKVTKQDDKDCDKHGYNRPYNTSNYIIPVVPVGHRNENNDKCVDGYTLTDGVSVALGVSLPFLIPGILIILIVKFCGRAVGMPVRKYPICEDGWIYGENWVFNVRVGQGTLYHGRRRYRLNRRWLTPGNIDPSRRSFSRSTIGVGIDPEPDSMPDTDLGTHVVHLFTGFLH